MERDRVRDLLYKVEPGSAVLAQGWVRTKRESKNVCFLEVNDGSSLSNLQVIIDKGNTDLQEAIDSISTGASVSVTGTLVESPGGNQRVELSCATLELLGAAPADYPMQKKRHSFEFLRQIAHLRPRTNTFGAVARVRNALSYAIHTFFQKRGFIYVHTPIITASDAEGAGELFRVTTLPPAGGADSERSSDPKEEFFGRPSYLTVSGQLNAEIYATALDRVYTFGPTFRAENSNTSRHLAEFWMIEPEMAFCELSCNMELAESFIKEILKTVLTEQEEDMAFFDKRILNGLLHGLTRLIEADFAHMTYTEAIRHLESAPRAFEFKPEWGADLQSEHEKYLTEEVVGGPVFVTDYPKEIKAFYMKQNEDGKSVRAMDLLVPRLGEIIGGSEREDDLDRLSRRIEEVGLDPSAYWWYLDLRKYGSVPHSGFGLGFERLIQYVTGMQNIRDVIPFPRTPGSAEF
ncbi:MAG: asparagine--tRNA ligase [Spirochaetaceae bacterium]